MRLLFIKTKNIGDALLLTPTLAAARQAYPDAEIWVVVRRGTEGILAGCPAISRILTTAAPESHKRGPAGWREDLRLLFELRAQQFDYAFDLSNGDRGRLLAGLSGARTRCTNGAVYPPGIWRAFFNSVSAFNWRNRHQVEADFFTVNECLPLKLETPPPLVFERSAARACNLGAPLENYLVMHPGTRWQRKQWLLENWIHTGRELLKSFSKIVVSVGPDRQEVELGDKIVAALGPRAVSTRGQLDWAQLAGLLFGARMFLGVDTAAMHLAAACQCPAVALFAATVAQQWRPWRVTHRLVGATLQPGEKDSAGAMAAITPGEVLAACGQLSAEAKDA